MEINELNAGVRTAAGKGHARRLRKEGLAPAVFYGPGAETIMLAVNAAELMKLRKKAENAFIKLIINDQGKRLEKLSVLKELQLEPVSRQIVHADFYEITMDHKITLDIPVHFIGKSQGVEAGGELHLLKREVKISCLPGSRPEFFAADISGLMIGGSLKVHDLSPGEGVTILDHAEAVLATVSAIKETVTPEAATVEAVPGEAADAETPAK